MMNDDVRHLEIWILVIIRVLSFDCIYVTVELSIVAVGFRAKESLKIPERIHYLLDKPPVGTRFLYQFLEYVLPTPTDCFTKLYFPWISIIILIHLKDSDIPTQNIMVDIMKELYYFSSQLSLLLPL